MSDQAQPQGAPEQLVRIANVAPAEVCKTLELTDEGVALLADDPAPTAFLMALLQDACFEDAVHYLANALDDRGAVAWACRCVRHFPDEAQSEADEAAIVAAETWVQSPSQDACDDAGAAAEVAGLESMASLTALAAQWSGESMVSPDLPQAPPPPELTAKAVAGSVMMAATSSDSEEWEQRYKACLAIGIEIAKHPAA